MRKFFRFCLFEIKSQIIGSKSIFIIIILTVAVTMMSVLILINILSTSVSSIEEINQQKCIYYPNICIDLTWNEMKDEIEYISDFLDSSELPTLTSYDYYLRLNYEENDMINVSDQNTVSIGLNIIPDANNLFSRDIYEKAKQEIIVGEMPDLYEKNDIPKIILSTKTRNDFFSSADIGSVIEIGDRQYNISAIVSSDKNYVLGIDLEDNYESQFLIDTLIFSEQLNSSQRNYYHLVLSKYKGSEDANLYETRRFGEIITYITYCVIVLLLLFFCMVTITRLFRYVFTDRLYVYNIYKIHGIKQRELILVLGSDIVLITAGSSVFGILLFMFSKPIQRYFQIYENIQIEIMLTVIAALLFLSLITAFPTINKLAKRPPLDRAFWR